ncbi:hypothetical protein SAMN04489740_3816 [Arthrobacter alpinus]|uniref:Uncharacterized protein n=1 Tax=Arthrobacter alpinus TaxID=656366 RepID=A0A1H5NL49_9MICC|nr:hypothetical protein [Arthrobacter alpinus]SEF02369.1 hypothetical protein SAMN04489740_3816 [Arthrobacter alpinus]
MTETELRMTDHELLALLSMTPTESAATTLGLLRLDQHGDNELFRHAGVTTLMVRGLAAPQGEKIVPVENAAIVGSVIAQAQEWLEITLAAPASSHLLFAVGSNVGAVLLSISPFGVHDVQPIESGPAMMELGLHLCNEYLAAGTEGFPAKVSIRRMRVDAETVQAFLTAVESGPWELALGSVESTHPAAEALENFKAALSA